MHMNSAKEYQKDKVLEPSPVTKFNNGSRYPLLSGLLIGAIGGAAGTLLYNAFHETRLWGKMAFVSDRMLKMINLSYKLPVIAVVVLVVAAAAASFLYFRRPGKL